ncbi:MAG: hypothetical protein ED559_09025 [Phycisphaera sp.]|nr:MAG: hypothetical protein ED559_09025 [Phycisphaera sp.]
MIQEKTLSESGSEHSSLPPLGDPSTIDEVISALETLIVWADSNSSRIGYFAALYLRVTVTIKSKIGTGYFDDDARMERMDVNFAGHYFSALRQYQDQSPDLLNAWKLALDATQQDDLIIVQHLLAAMNPHINLDLASAAAATCPGDSIHAFRGDFDKINDVLSSLVPTVISEISGLSPLIRLAMDIGEHETIEVVNFSMDAARDFAWLLALELASLPQAEQALIIQKRDVPITALGRDVIVPGFPWQEILDLIGAVESKDVIQNINGLDSGNPLETSVRREAVSGEAPNKVYYFEIAKGVWAGTFRFRMKSWSEFWRSKNSLGNKLIFAAIGVWQRLFGNSKMYSKIDIYPDRGEAGVARNHVAISRFGIRLFTSDEDYILSPDGTGVTVDAHVRFGPIPFLFREHDVYPAEVYDGGYRNLYFMKLLKTRPLGKYRVSPDGNEVQSHMEWSWAEAEEVLQRVSH